MRRILICECKQEVSSFNPVVSRYEDFLIDRGPDVLQYHRPVKSEVGGALSVFDERQHLDLIGGYSARGITSAGTLGAAAFDRLSGEFLEVVRSAGPVDGIYFSLHGALASEDVSDTEGFLLAETRKIVGERIPIVASFDLHGILTDEILRHADVITVFHTYPHVDFFQTGQRAARVLLRLMDGEIEPAMVRVAIPALVRGYELITETGMWGKCVRRTIEFENSEGGLSGAMFIGNPFTDVPDLCSNVYLAADGDTRRAEAEAVSIAEEFWAMREHLQQPLTPLAGSVRMAMECAGRVVLVDAADATSSGAPGDSNAILRALVEAGCTRTALIPIVDPFAVQTAIKAGVSASVELNVGGALDPRHRPLTVKGEVRLLFDGNMRSESHGEEWIAGPSAVVRCGPNTLVLTTRPVSLYDRTLFLACGQDPATFDMTVVKSPHCQPRFFADGAALMINIDAPGATSANLPSLGHTKCRRPIFPLDESVSFSPEVKVFRRNR